MRGQPAKLFGGQRDAFDTGEGDEILHFGMAIEDIEEDPENATILSSYEGEWLLFAEKECVLTLFV